MASRGLEGFLEDGSSIDMMKSPPFSYSSSLPSSSSSSSRQKAFIPFTFNHNHHHKKPSWLYNNNNPQDQEEHIMMDSSSHPNNNNNFIPLRNCDGTENHLHQFIINPSPSATTDGREGECSEAAAMAAVHKEHMFDKVVTPSDVGKLNRLVVPKQHAEKYFPLDSSNNEKGLLLNFEDRVGKPWRFRYSYWNSSQSYVMTKGWSRFVKDKKLDAGDVVSFQRGVGEEGKHRFFIDWRRRPDAPPHPPFYRRDYLQAPQVPPFSIFREQVAAAGHFHQSHQHVHNNVYGRPSSFIYLKSTAGNGGGGCGDDRQHWPTKVLDSGPVVQGKGAAKRLRLFGVNMDCPILETSTSNECEIIESKVIAHHQQFRHVISANENVNNKGKTSLALDLNIWQN